MYVDGRADEIAVRPAALSPAIAEHFAVGAGD